MCSSFTALTVSLQMKKKNSSSHSFCDINDKERTGQALMYYHSSIFEHEASWTELTWSLIFILAGTSLLRFLGEDREREEGKGRQTVYQIISSFILQLWKQSETTYPCAGHDFCCLPLSISCTPEVCHLWTGGKHHQDTSEVFPVAGYSHQVMGGDRKGIQFF